MNQTKSLLDMYSWLENKGIIGRRSCSALVGVARVFNSAFFKAFVQAGESTLPPINVLPCGHRFGGLPVVEVTFSFGTGRSSGAEPNKDK